MSLFDKLGWLTFTIILLATGVYVHHTIVKHSQKVVDKVVVVKHNCPNPMWMSGVDGDLKTFRKRIDNCKTKEN